MQEIEETRVGVLIPAVRTIVVIVVIHQVLPAHLSFQSALTGAIVASHVAHIVLIPVALIVPVVTPVGLPVGAIVIAMRLSHISILSLLVFSDPFIKVFAVVIVCVCSHRANDCQQCQ